MKKRGPKEKHPVIFTDEQKTYLKKFVKSGTGQARETLRARILLESEEANQNSVREIAQRFEVNPTTVRTIRRRFMEQGMEEALFDRPRPGQPERLSGEQKAHIIALACSDPPEGRESWSIRLLTDKAVEMGIVETIGRETIRRTLKKTN